MYLVMLIHAQVDITVVPNLPGKPVPSRCDVDGGADEVAVAATARPDGLHGLPGGVLEARVAGVAAECAKLHDHGAGTGCTSARSSRV